MASSSEYSKYDSFDPLAYLKKKYSSVTEWIAQPLKELHTVFESYAPPDSSSVSVLEYGCGPIPIYMCSAPVKATELVFAEYEKGNRDILQAWLNGDPNSPDYTPFFKYVVQQLEGQSGDEAVSKRQDDLKCIVKGVVTCDATIDPPLPIEYTGPYDVIFSSLCLTVTAKNIEEYSINVSRLVKILKPGGKLILNSVEARDGNSHLTYWVNEEKFYALSLTVESLDKVMKENGMRDVKITRTLLDDIQGGRESMSPQVLAMIFVVATKQ